jgi:hypothetical protein
VKNGLRNLEEHELSVLPSVAGAMLLFSMILTLSACLQEPAPPPSGEELRAAMQALRNGKAGEASFDSALPLLPELIRSGSGNFVAGGAHLAGQLGRSECVPALVTALEHENARAANGSEHPTRAILDALIRLEARVPHGTLLARPDVRFAAQVYVLSMHDAEHGAEALAQLMAQGFFQSPAHWAAACALTHARDRRVAEHLLAGSAWELEIGVRLPGSEAELGLYGSGGQWSTPHASWPPRAYYDLRLPKPDEPLQPIAHVRREHLRSGPRDPVIPAEERTGWRVRLIDALLREAPERGLLHGSESFVVDLVDAASYQREIQGRVDELIGRWERVLAALDRQDLIGDPVPVRARLSFAIRIVDLRPEGSPALPLPPQRADVRYTDP